MIVRHEKKCTPRRILSLIITILLVAISCYTYTVDATSNSTNIVRVVGLNIITKNEIFFSNQISYDGRHYSSPSISKGNAVWADNDEENKGFIIAGNLSTGAFDKIEASRYNYNPYISEEYITWVGRGSIRSTIGDIYLYNLHTKVTKILSNHSDNYREPRISSEFLIWYTTNSSGQNHNSIVTIYNLSSNTSNSIQNANLIDGLAIHKNIIFYVEDSNSIKSLYLYNITERKKERVIYNIDYRMRELSISNDLLVWAGVFNMTVYNYITKEIKTINSFSRSSPQISGQNVVFENLTALPNDGTIHDAFLYNLTDDNLHRITEISKTVHTWEQLKPGIDGDWIVWYDGEETLDDNGMLSGFQGFWTIVATIVIVKSTRKPLRGRLT